MSTFLPLISQKLNSFTYYELKCLVFVMTKAASNRDICITKAVLLMCEHEHFSLHFSSISISGWDKNIQIRLGQKITISGRD